MLARIFEKIHEGAFAKPGIHRLWEKLPERAPLETVAELYASPALITHAGTDSIVYANEAARLLLGESVVGTSFQPAPGIRSLAWPTPAGEKPVRYKAQKLRKGSESFYFLELREAV